MTKTTVLIVDDSRTMRAVIRARLAADPDIMVIGEAADPYEAREAIKALNPDVVTLDVEMPKMNGLEFLEKLMRLRPTPVIMISTLTQSGAAASIEALALGAFDVVGKPAGTEFSTAFEDLAEKVKAAAESPLGVVARKAIEKQKVVEADIGNTDKIVFIGASTGGVEALMQVIGSVPADCPPTLITQHMPAQFTTSFAARLDASSSAQVMEAYDGAPLKQGVVYLAPGGGRHLALGPGQNATCRLFEGDLVSGHRPSVDVLFQSAARLQDKAIGVILTGMGADGAAGLKSMRDAGAYTIGQDRQSCVVYGMPRVAFEAGGVIEQVSLSKVAGAIGRACARTQQAAS